MDRRAFLITSGGAAVAAAASGAALAGETASAPADQRPAAAGARHLRLAMAWADTPQGPADSARRLARRLETLTGGRYRIEVLAAAGGAGDADLLHGTAHDFAAAHPAFHYFAGLPGSGGLGAQDLAHWLAVGGGQMLWDDLAAGQGWKPLVAGHMGEAPPLWSLAPISTLADLAGRRVAAAGLGADVARALGADGQALRGEAAAALRDGTLDAVEAGGLIASLAAGLPQAARHANGFGLNRHGTALALSVRLPVWEAMADADRAILAAATAEELQATLAEARAHEHLMRRALAASFGVTFAPWPGEIAEAIERVAEATIAHVAGHDAVAARIDQSYMAFRAALNGTERPRRGAPVMPVV